MPCPAGENEILGLIKNEQFMDHLYHCYWAYALAYCSHYSGYQWNCLLILFRELAIRITPTSSYLSKFIFYHTLTSKENNGNKKKKEFILKL